MQFVLDEALNKFDELYVRSSRLAENYRKFCYGEDTGVLQQCEDEIEKLKAACRGTNLDIEQLLDNLCTVIASSQSGQNSQEVASILELLQQSIQREYLILMHDEASYRQVKIENYFGTAYGKTALIIYIVYPFLFPDTPLGHTNQQEVRVMAELLRDQGYNVDIVNTRYAGELTAEQYKLIIGSGRLFESLCARRKPDGVYVYYLTESSPYFWNPAEMKRLQDFTERNHYTLPFERQADTRLNLQVLSMADAAVCIGNQWTVSTYKGMFPKIYPLDVSGFQIDIQPDFDMNGRSMSHNFMWYGGAGPVHKGLDLCIEAFRSLPELNLHVVGEPNAQFYDFYRKDIEEAENIYYYGFLNKDSQQFIDVCGTCAFCISPSCAEGQSTSVLTSMFAGMIPICTVQTGIDLEKCGGIWIENIGVEQISALLKELSQLSDEEIGKRRRAAYDYVCKDHTLTSYRKNMKYILDDILMHRQK